MRQNLLRAVTKEANAKADARVKHQMTIAITCFAEHKTAAMKMRYADEKRVLTSFIEDFRNTDSQIHSSIDRLSSTANDKAAFHDLVRGPLNSFHKKVDARLVALSRMLEENWCF